MDEPYWLVGIKLDLRNEVSAEFVKNTPNALMLAKHNSLWQIQRYVANLTLDDIQATYVESSIDFTEFSKRGLNE